jgi:hypothetical protein
MGSHPLVAGMGQETQIRLTQGVQPENGVDDMDSLEVFDIECGSGVHGLHPGSGCIL